MLEDPIVKDQFLIGPDTVFDFGHRIFSPSDITCYVYDPTTGSETMLTSGTDFSVGLKPETTDYSNGARVTLLTEQPAAGKLTVVRTVVPEQGVSLPNFGKIPSESLEAQLDRTIASVQQLHDTVQLAYKIPYGQSGTTTPEDEIKKMISSGGGGGGGGGSSYEFSNEFTVTSGGSVSVNKIDKSKIEGLSSVLDDKQDKLVSGGSYNINVDSASSAGSATSAGYAPYTGPFALSGTSTPYGFFYGINDGNVYFGGSAYSISSSTGGSTPLPSGSAIYLHFYSSIDGYTYEYVTSVPSTIPDDHYYTRIGENSGGKAVQFQYGDIRLQEPSGGGGIAYPDYNHGAGLSVSTYYTTSGGQKTGYTALSSQGGLIFGTIQATSASAVGANIQLMAGANEALEQTYLQTVFNPDPSGTSEILVCIPIGPDTDFIITYDNCMVSTEYSDSPGVHISTLSFYPYIIHS